ncbi:MAG: NAD(P)/FAD-dependent oxidoreductase [Thermodesulfobacteriota bacterium]
MADATYDAIVIGGGTSGLTVANYLVKYGGLKTAIFEARPELGGGWGSEDLVPGFIANTHAAEVRRYYTLPLEWDFPLKERGFEFLEYPVARGTIFKEDLSSFCIYSPEADPSGERSAASLAKFSRRDADTWLWLTELYHRYIKDAVVKSLFNPPPPPGEPNPLEKLWLDLCKRWPERIDPAFLVRSELEIWRDLFENEAVIAALCRHVHSITGTSPDIPGGGAGRLFAILCMVADTGAWRGGTHSLAHIMSRIFVEAGGEFFTKSEVERVIIDNGRARGVRLVDGTEVKARQLVVSTLDPASLCFRLIGKEHLPFRLAQRVAHLDRWRICITWYGWAVHELPHYRTAESDPDIDRAGRLVLTRKDPLAMVKNHAWRRLGMMCPELNLCVWGHTSIDPTQAAEGKHALGSEDFVLPATSMSAEEWKEFKRKHAEDTVREWSHYAPNMTWDNVIGYLPLTPVDATNCANFGPEGCWAVIDMVPSQMGGCRPAPELAQHRTPIAGLYATGAGWHRGGGGSSTHGYNCYKVIARELNLGKPWEASDRPF